MRLPLLGIAFDINDLGVIGGLVLTALLYVLAASIRRETLNLDLAMKRAFKSDARANLDLLLMAQVLSPAPSKMPESQRLLFLRVRLPNFALFLIVTILPIVVQTFVCAFDWKTMPVGSALTSTEAERNLCLIETAVTVLVAGFAVLCAWEQHRLHQGFSKLIEAKRRLNGTEAISNGYNGQGAVEAGEA
ncbi:MAG: hypothetical protein JOZ08_09265 [Verrucomicrobia bacterium]|nr:hypothetical protein [Verrucomicrobiota bacterium]MBV8273881.1 hypothetical protein [Verrucomicrobiota bacterium]